MAFNRTFSQNGDIGASFRSSRRAPDPTQIGRRGVSTMNVKHKAAISRAASRKSQDAITSQENPRGSASKAKLANYFSRRPNSDEMRRNAANSLRKKRMKKANTTSIKDDDSFSDGGAKKRRNKRQKSLKGTMPRRMKNLLSTFYKKKPPTRETSDADMELFETEQDLINEANEGSLHNQKFKDTIIKKYAGNAVGTYGFSTDKLVVPKTRRESNFGEERPMVLLLGRAKAGKSTLFKQLMALSGAPPNYARAYRPTKAPVEEDITIEDADLTLVDVGGSNEDVVDWRFYLTSAEIIVYVVALDDFDRVIPGKEGDEKTKPYTYLTEALELFDSIIRNVALLNSKFVLVLNKADRFKKKVCDRKITLNSVGAYDDAPTSTDYEESVEFVEDLFLERAESSEHEVEIEVTSAIDAEECGDMLGRLTQRLVKSKDVTKWKNLL